MLIEIWSDIACPFCFIGKHKLEKAIETLGLKDEIEIAWRSYELNPNLAKEPLNKSYYEYLAGAHGESVEEAKKGCETLLESAKEVGLNFDLDRVVTTNTSDALRLVKFADESGLANEAEEALFCAYFVEGKCISDRKVLIQIANKIGLPEDEVNRMLDSDKYLAEIDKDISFAEDELKLEYIPFYRINEKHSIQGAIKASEYIEAIDAAYKEWKNGEKMEDMDFRGQSCSIDGVCS